MDQQGVAQIVNEDLARLNATIEQEFAIPHQQRMALAEQEIISVKGTIDAEVTSMKSTIDAGMLKMQAQSSNETEALKGIIDAERTSVKQRVQEWEGKQEALRNGMEAYVTKTRDETIKNVGDAKAEMERVKGGIGDMQKDMQNVVSDMYVKMQEMKSEMAGMKHGGQIGERKSGMPILDTRSVGNLKVMGGDRGEYREWVEQKCQCVWTNKGRMDDGAGMDCGRS